MARDSYLESLRVLAEGGDKLLIATCLEGLSEVMLALEGCSPAAIFLSTAFAAARATSGVGVQNACKRGSSFSMRASAALTGTAFKELHIDYAPPPAMRSS